MISFDGCSKDDCDNADNDEAEECSGIKYCLISQRTLERISLVIRDQLDTCDQDLGKLKVPDTASFSPELPSSSLSQLM